jgi:regulator of replication initiation timing
LIKIKDGSQDPNFEEVYQMIMNLKVQVEDTRGIEETLKNQLEENEKMKESFEAEIVSLRKELQKKEVQQNDTKILDEIVSIQRPYYEKSRLGYQQPHTKKGLTSSIVAVKRIWHDRFLMMDMGPLHYFLSLENGSDPSGIKIS